MKNIKKWLKKKFGKRVVMYVFDGKGKLVEKRKPSKDEKYVFNADNLGEGQYKFEEIEETNKEYKRRLLYTSLGVLLVMGIVFSSYTPFKNIDLLYNNSIGIQQDSSAIKVTNIGIDDTLTLEDSSFIKSDTVKGYVKVRKGEGTWYLKGENYLVVEITNKELISLFIPIISYFAGLTVYTLILGFRRKIKWSKVKIAGYVLLNLYCLYFIGMLVEELLR